MTCCLLAKRWVCQNALHTCSWLLPRIMWFRLLLVVPEARSHQLLPVLLFTRAVVLLQFSVAPCMCICTCAPYACALPPWFVFVGALCVLLPAAPSCGSRGWSSAWPWALYVTAGSPGNAVSCQEVISKVARSVAVCMCRHLVAGRAHSAPRWVDHLAKRSYSRRLHQPKHQLHMHCASASVFR